MTFGDIEVVKRPLLCVSTLSVGQILWMVSAPVAQARDYMKTNEIYEVGELFELGIQLSYLLLLLGFLGVGTFFVIRQVLVRRELDLSAKELQVTLHIFLYQCCVDKCTRSNNDFCYKFCLICSRDFKKDPFGPFSFC